MCSSDLLLASAAVAEHMRSQRMQAQKAQRMLQAAYQDSPVGLFTLDRNLVIIKANPAFHNMLRQLATAKASSLSDLFGNEVVQQLQGLRTAKGSTSIDHQVQVVLPRAGEPSWFAIKASTVDGSAIECSLQDITERVQSTERLEYLASHDPLTGCLNLRGLALETSKPGYQPTALAYFDLDRFKLINDLYGHNAGDNVLRQVAERMATVLHRHDKLARVGGDKIGRAHV